MAVELLPLNRFTLKLATGLGVFCFGFPVVAQNSNLGGFPPYTPPQNGVQSSFANDGANLSGVAAEEQYTLGEGDRIRIDILQVPELSGEYLILFDGTVTLPLVGTVPLKGLTLPQANQILSQRYAAYVKDPTLSVILLGPRPLKIAMVGEIARPGAYTIPFENRSTFPSVTELIQLAGGLTTVADISQVQVRRFSQGQEQVLQVDLSRLVREGNLNQDLTLRDGDTVLIPTQQQIDPKEIRQLSESNFGIQVAEVDIAVVGEVSRPGSYTVRADRGTNAQNTNINLRLPRLTLAIQLAGGIKPLADIRQIEIRRQTRTGEEQTFNVDLWQLLETGNLDEDVILQQGDTIIVPSAEDIDPAESETLASASFAPNAINVNIVGEVRRPGVLQLPPNTPLNQGILAAGGFDRRRANEATIELIRLNPNGTVSKRNIDVNFAKGIDGENNPTLRNNDVIVVNRNVLTTIADTMNTILSPLGTVIGLTNFVRVFWDFNDNN